MKNKALQIFSKERLALDAKLTADQIVRFLSEYQSLVHGQQRGRKLISLRIPEDLLIVFKTKAANSGIRYQTQIIDLMRQWATTQEIDCKRVSLPKKIVSGGQTGVDRAALDLCMALGVPCGGWCPKGRLAEDGRIDERYPLVETVSAHYEERTEWNVRDSDATLVLTWGKPTGGTLVTIKVAKQWKKPLLVVDLSDNPDYCMDRVRRWIREQKPAILNVGGPRASQGDKIYRETYKFLYGVLQPRC